MLTVIGHMDLGRHLYSLVNIQFLLFYCATWHKQADVQGSLLPFFCLFTGLPVCHTDVMACILETLIIISTNLHDSFQTCTGILLEPLANHQLLSNTILTCREFKVIELHIETFIMPYLDNQCKESPMFVQEFPHALFDLDLR